MVTGLLQGPLGLTPAGLQVFGTGPEEHAVAVERVKKAKVRLLPDGQMLPSQCLWAPETLSLGEMDMKQVRR